MEYYLLPIYTSKKNEYSNTNKNIAVHDLFIYGFILIQFI